MNGLNKKTKIMVEGALMIALATAMSFVMIFNLPYGGSVTLEMVPLVVMSYRHGAKWGFLTAFIHGIIQMMIGFGNVMACPTIISQLGCILLDYLLGFGVLGFAYAIGKLSRLKGVGYILAGSIGACFLRWLCSFISGFWLWGAYAPEGMNPFVYSAVYNASYMAPSAVIVVIVLVLLYKINPHLFEK